MKLYYFAESDSYCEFYITFAENEEEAKQKILINLKYQVALKSQDEELNRYVIENLKENYYQILNGKWIAKEIESEVFKGEWS